MKTEEPITELLHRANNGDEDARNRLWEVLTPLLKQRAHLLLKGNNVAGIVRTSDVAQDAILQLLQREPMSFKDRQHLLGYAAVAMRHLIIDLARKHKPGERQFETIDEQLGLKLDHDVSWIEVDEILKVLEAQRPLMAQVVVLRAFGGLTNEEIAEVRGISLATVKRQLQLARARIMSQLQQT